MKLKLTLQSSGGSSVRGGSRDLVATMDASTTIGDLAAYLVRADPQPYAVGGEGDVTLAVVDERAQLDRVVDPGSTVPESGLRSGVTVAVTRCSESFVDAGPAVAVFAIVAGPDVGKEFPLRRGTAYIGRGHGCEVQVCDSSVSRRHAKLLVASGAEVVDLGSANGISIGGTQVARTVLTAGDRLRLGDTELEVRLLGVAAGASTDDSLSAVFVRSPRIAPTFEGRELELPELPERPKPSRAPWLAMMVPALMGMGLFAFTRSPYSLMFVLMSPMMMLGNHVEQSRGGKKEFARRMRDFREDLGVLATRIRESLQVEADLRRGEHPSSTDCAEACRTSSPLLWTRRGDTEGFLQLRLGQGTLPSRSSMKMPAVGRSKAEAWVELAAAIDGLSVVSDVPIVVDPLTTGAIGVSGLRSAALPVARSLVLQAVSLHSPAELIVATFASSTSAPDWDWLKWVPHTTSPHSPISAAHLTSSALACSKLLSELEDLVAPSGEHNRGQAPARPRVLVLVENDAPVERSRLVQLAERGWRRGICVVWLAPETTLLPAACRVFIEVTGNHGDVGYVNEGKLITPVAVEAVSLEQTLAAARWLAPLEYSGTPVDDDSDLPLSVSLLTLTGTDLARSPQAVVERWGESRSILTGPFAPATPHRKPGNLRAIVGQSAQGTFSLDLRSDGPHALVGGTTGAGKSELLQAWILGMAAAHSPQRVTFLLVDYKGGSAFRDCVALPHTVGLVTDLSPHLVRRALASLSAELRYREHLLARHRAKDLAELERRGEVDVPPSLVIVVDEFAALVQEVPGFVEGVVNVAQRGRSLGLHLILATQRPAGVIKDNLRANTNLRLALRVGRRERQLGRARLDGGRLFRPGRPRSGRVQERAEGTHPVPDAVCRWVDLRHSATTGGAGRDAGLRYRPAVGATACRGRARSRQRGPRADGYPAPCGKHRSRGQGRRAAESSGAVAARAVPGL